LAVPFFLDSCLEWYLPTVLSKRCCFFGNCIGVQDQKNVSGQITLLLILHIEDKAAASFVQNPIKRKSEH